MTDNDDYSDDFEDEEHSDGGGKRGGGDEADAGDRKSPEAGGASDGVSEDLANSLPPSCYPDEPRNEYGGGAGGGGGGGGAGGDEGQRSIDGASTLRPSAVGSTAAPPRLHSSPSGRVAIGSPDRQRGGGEDRRRPRTAYRRSYDGSDPNAIAQINWKRGKQIGMGSFGAVHLAINKDDGSFMAVKEMEVFGDAIEQKKVRMEIELMRELEHPNIVRYLGTDVNGDERRRTLFIFCEWVAGGSLQGVVDQFGPLSHTVVSQYTRQMLEGLRYLHDKCIIHRDIKPGNVLVDDIGTCVGCVWTCVDVCGETKREMNTLLCCSTQY